MLTTSSRRMQATLYAALLMLVLVLNNPIAVSAAGSSVVITTPDIPLLDVPFLATSGLGAGKTLYLSTTPQCNAALSPVPVCTLGNNAPELNHNATTCLFTVTSASIDVNPATVRTAPPMYWCSSAFGTENFQILGIEKMVVNPPYVYVGTPTTLKVNEATPVDTIIGFYDSAKCSASTLIGDVMKVTAARTVSLTIKSGHDVFMCAKVPTVLGDMTTSFLADSVFVTLPYDILVFNGLRHRTVPVDANAIMSIFSLSLDPHCIPLAQPASTNMEENFMMLNIDVPRGSYYFCASANSKGEDTIYVPALSLFTVQEYGVFPSVLYTGHQTNMMLTMDAVQPGIVFEFGLFRTLDCKDAIINWGTSTSWTVNAVGTYYSCVREVGNIDDTQARATTISVVDAPQLTFSRNPGILGLGLSVDVERADSQPGVISVGLSSSKTCEPLFTFGSTTETRDSADFYVPVDGPALATICVSTPHTTEVYSNKTDNSNDDTVVKPFFYNTGTMELDQYALTYPPLRTNTQMSMELDPSVTFAVGSIMKLVPDSEEGCAAKVSGENKNEFPLSSSTTALTPVLFPTDGNWLLCVSEPKVLDGVFQPLRNLIVYGDATMSPRGIVTGLHQTVTITHIPPNAEVYFVPTPNTCTGSSVTKLFPTNSSAAGVADTNVDYDTAGNLTLCAAYRGASGASFTDPVIYPVGQLVSAPPIVDPTVAIATFESRLSFIVPDPLLLGGDAAYLKEGTTTCLPNPPVDSIQLVIIAGNPQTGERPYALFTPPVTGVVYGVCVGRTGNFVPAGSVTIAEQLDMVSVPIYVPKGMPAMMRFSGPTFDALHPNRFVLIAATDSCSDAGLPTTTVYVSGALSGSGESVPFLAPTDVNAVTVCVTDTSSSGIESSAVFTYTFGGLMTLYDFTSLSAYAQIGKTNALEAWPLATNAGLYLTPCSGNACTPAVTTATCKAAPTAKKFYTSELQQLQGATAGNYALCQEAVFSSTVTAVVGANTTVQVVNPWVLTTTETEIRQFKPFTVTLSGGVPIWTTASTKAYAAGTYVIRVQRADTPCTSALGEGQDFTLTTATSSLTITDVDPITPIYFCLYPTPHDRSLVMDGTLLFYMTPTTIITATATPVRSGMLENNALARISSKSDCSTGTPQLITNFVSTQEVESCGPNKDVTSAYYCESTDAGSSFAPRGKMGLLRRSPCSGGADASINPVTVAPAQKISEFGIDEQYLTSPFLSTTGDCKNPLDARVLTLGYTPRFDETAVFFVCASIIDGDSTPFTTIDPTLTVANWAVTPTSILSRFNTTAGELPTARLNINYVTPSAKTTISTTSTCSDNIADASGFSSPSKTSTLRITGYGQLLYVCTPDTLTADGGSPVAVASFLSVTPPAVPSIQPAIIRGAPFSARLVVQGLGSQPPVYSMHQGADADFPFSDYYTSTEREVFLSADKCASVLDNTVASSVDTSDDSVTFVTSDIAKTVSSVALCAGTPAGSAVTVSSVSVAAGMMYPTQFVTGSVSPIYIPLNPNTKFFLSNSNGNCNAVSSTNVAPFTTDAEGYASMTLIDTKENQPADEGTYTICSGSPTPNTPLGTILLLPPSYFNIRGLTYVIGVPGIMMLLNDLTTEYLLEGFSTNNDCRAPDTTFGSWKTESPRQITVTATDTKLNLFLCARAPINNTLVALPSINAVQFVTQTIIPPTSGFDVCNAATMHNCYAPGTPGLDGGVLAMVYGPCCDEASRSRVLGRTQLGSNKCQMDLNAQLVNAYPVGTKFNLCAWSTADPNYCTTVDEVEVERECKADVVTDGSKLSRGWLITIIILSIVVGLLLIALIIFLIWWCCCRKKKEEGTDERKMIAMRHMEEGAYDYDQLAIAEGEDDAAAIQGNHHMHPLLFYPGGSEGEGQSLPATTSRSISANTDGTGTTSTQYHTLVENIEDDERDQIALQEARERYNLRLAFTEELEHLRLREKENEIDLGYEDDEDNGGVFAIGREHPDARAAVEEIECDEETYVPTPEEEAAAARLKEAAGLAATAENSVVDPNDTTLRDLSEGAEQSQQGKEEENVELVRSRSICSSRPRTPPAHESFFTDDDAGEEICIDDEGEENGANDADGEQQDTSAAAAVPAPRRYPVERSMSSEAVHVDPSLLNTSNEEHSSILQKSQQQRSRPRQNAFAATPTRDSSNASRNSNADAVDDSLLNGGSRQYVNLSVADSSVLERSPILRTEDDGEGQSSVPLSIQEMQFGSPSNGLVDVSRNNEMNASQEEEMDELSYTTTQRFYDETRVLLEEEDIRRQRLCNWEEEERAQLAQEELEEYMHTAQNLQAMAMSSAGDYSREEYEDDDDEEVYVAPVLPAQLPRAPAPVTTPAGVAPTASPAAFLAKSQHSSVISAGGQSSQSAEVGRTDGESRRSEAPSVRRVNTSQGNENDMW